VLSTNPTNRGAEVLSCTSEAPIELSETITSIPAPSISTASARHGFSEITPRT
jgi:hypothetical protein